MKLFELKKIQYVSNKYVFLFWSVLDAEQGGRDQEGRVVPGLRGQGRHPLPVPRLQRKPALDVQR